MFGTYSLGMIAMAGLFFLNTPVFAEAVDHHGLKVDNNSGHFECLSCHDGAFAHSVAFCTENCDGNFVHPVDRKYPPRGKEREYASIGELNGRGIKLLNNRVSCISCHDLKNNAKNHPVKVNRLCLSCHLK